MLEHLTAVNPGLLLALESKLGRRKYKDGFIRACFPFSSILLHINKNFHFILVSATRLAHFVHNSMAGMTVVEWHLPETTSRATKMSHSHRYYLFPVEENRTITWSVSGTSFWMNTCWSSRSPKGPGTDKQIKMSAGSLLQMTEPRWLSWALIEFEPPQNFLESRREFSLVWPELVTVEEISRESQLSATLILVWPGLKGATWR